jgi:hypothetical protein
MTNSQGRREREIEEARTKAAAEHADAAKKAREALKAVGRHRREVT